MELKNSDFKLLSYLYHNNRESVTKIAKACKLSREQVDYKLKKYISSGLIIKFITVFDYNKFGYNYFVSLFLKFEKPSSIKLFSQKIVKSKNCVSWGTVFNKYDLVVNCVFKDEKELSDYISKLVSDSENPISDYFVIKPYFAELYPLKFFNHKDREKFSVIESNSKQIKFDNKDMGILKALDKDGRARLVDIASKLNISSELCLYKLRKLYKDKIILGSRIQFDMNKLGYYFSLILLNIRNFSEDNQNKIKQFAKNSKHVNSLIFSLMKPNCIIQLFHKEESELRKSIEEIKELFKDESFEIDVMLINQDEEEINTLPFLN